MDPAEAALVAVAGFLAGGVNAVAGGGSLVSFPALVAVGLPPLTANVTNTTAVWPGYLGAALAYRAEVRAQAARIRSLSASAVAGGGAGAVVLLTAPDAVFDAVVPFLVLAGAGLLVAQPRIAAWTAARRPDGPHPAALHVAVGAAAVYGAYFGGGLGVILLAVLGIFVAEGMQDLNAVKSTLSLVINTVALVAFAVFGPVDWGAVALVAPASLAGGYVGGHVARRLPAGVLRVVVAAFGIAVAVWLFVR